MIPCLEDIDDDLMGIDDVVESRDRIFHAYPVRQGERHVLAEFPWLCPCEPEVEMWENGTVFVHRVTQ